MKKLLFIIVIFLSTLNFSQAEESRWVKKGAFWELPDSISNIQFTPEGDYFFVLDKVNYTFFKYKTETGLLEKTYDIQIPDSIDKSTIIIHLSPDTKTYTVSSIFMLNNKNKIPPIFFYDIENDSLLFIRAKLNSNTYDPMSKVKYPSLAIIIDNFIIYTVLKAHFKVFQMVFFKNFLGTQLLLIL